MKELIILSTGRAGTTYFCDALAQFDALFVGHEVFNPSACYGIGPLLPQISTLTGQSFRHQDDPALTALMRRDPGKAADLLAAAAAQAGHQALAYKVFPHQLRPDLLAPLLSRPGAAYLFITRNRLDVFASTVKSQALQTCRGRETTTLKPPFEVERFRDWATIRDRQLQAARNNCPGARTRVIRYETFINTDLATLHRRQQSLLAELGISAELPSKPTATTARQDRAVTTAEKFDAPATVTRTLAAAGLTDYALSPFLPPTA